MNRQETIKLLALIKVAYPTAYRDLDKATKQATVNMWQLSFPEVPYPVMEQAFNGLRMVSRFPPTVAEMAQQLHTLHYQAEEAALVNRQLGNEAQARRYLALMEATGRFRALEQLGRGYLLPGPETGGEYDAGASGNRLDRTDRLPILGPGKAGEGA